MFTQIKRATMLLFLLMVADVVQLSKFCLILNNLLTRCLFCQFVTLPLLVFVVDWLRGIICCYCILQRVVVPKVMNNIIDLGFAFVVVLCALSFVHAAPTLLLHCPIPMPWDISLYPPLITSNQLNKVEKNN